MSNTLARLLMLLSATISLGACRPRIPPTEVGARAMVPATPPADLRVCWVESARALGFTASSLVVRHPDGDLLIDGGNSTRFREEVAVYGPRDERWFKLLPGNLRPRVPLASRLHDARVDPAGLRWLLPTHAHLDHMGGFLDLPPAPVLLAAPEIELIERARHDLLFEVIPAHARAVAPRAQALRFTEERYEIFDRHADLFGDRSVVVVPLHGHTPGSVGVFLNLPDGRRIFHVGDAINDRRQLTRLRGRTPAMRRTDSDRPRAERVVGQLHVLAQRAPEIEFLPAHERRAWKDSFGTPSTDCRR